MISHKQVVYFSESLSLLYVEDEIDLRNEMHGIFQLFFKNITLAFDGSDGLQKYNQELFDIVITDINMPHMNGIEMIKNIREINPEQKIITITANDDSSTLMQLIKLGVQNFLVKPVDTQGVINTLYPVCRDAHAQKENLMLIEQLEEERSKLKAKVKELQTLSNVTKVKHQQVQGLLHQESSPKLADEYFAKDEDEGQENVLFLHEDADELRELFYEIPELMFTYTKTRSSDYIERAIINLKKVASVLSRYTPFLDTLSESFSILALVIEQNLEAFLEVSQDASPQMLMLWDAVNADMERYLERFGVESMAMKNIHHIHKPTSLSIQQIVAIINPEEVQTDEIEFF